MENILIATDLSVHCDRALERALRLAQSTGANLHVLHVAPVYKVPGEEKTSRLKTDTEELLQTYISSYTDSDKVNTNIIVTEGRDVLKHILEQSKTANADLIVMGLHDKVGFRDLFVGTTMERVIRKGHRPVLVVKDKPQGEYAKVISATDFSNTSKHSMRVAFGLAPKAKFQLVHAFHFADTAAGDKAELIAGDVIKQIEHKRLEEYLDENQNFITKHEIPSENVTYDIVQGEPYSALSRHVSETSADLLTIGAHGRATLMHSTIGGLAHDILTDPPCDVLISKGLPSN